MLLEWITIPLTGGRAELERLRVNATLQRPRHQSERFGDLKLFELKTMCLVVTLSDRAEAVVAHPDCDQ